MNYNELDMVVLKTVLTSKKHALEFAAECSEAMFTSDLFRFGKLVNDYIKIHKDVPTLRTLTQVMTAGNVAATKYCEDVFAALDSVVVNEKEYKFDLSRLKDRYADQLLGGLKDKVFAGDKLNGSIQDNVKNIQSALEKVKGLYQNKVFDQKTLKESIEPFKLQLSAAMKDPNHNKGLYTGYNFLDYQTNGLRPSEYLLVGGESGSGKSVLLQGLSLGLWLGSNTIDTPKGEYGKGANCIFFSLEMNYTQCLNRIISCLAQVPYRGIRDGSLNAEEIAKVSKALTFIKRYPYEFTIIDMPRGATIENIELIYNEVKIKGNKPDVVCIDYLGLMESDSNSDDWLRLGEISGSVHEFGRVHECVMLSAIQLNRISKSKDTTQDEKIGMHRIGRSALVVTHASIFLQIESRGLEENKFNDCLVHGVKMRDGAKCVGRLIKNFACCSLQNDYSSDNNTEVAIDDISSRIEALEN